MLASMLPCVESDVMSFKVVRVWQRCTRLQGGDQQAAHGHRDQRAGLLGFYGAHIPRLQGMCDAARACRVETSRPRTDTGISAPTSALVSSGVATTASSLRCAERAAGGG